MPGRRSRRTTRVDARAAIGAAAGLIAIGCLIVAHAARGVTFSGDDWTFITERRGFSAGVFLRPHGEHLSALPIAAYKLLLATFGASSYVPFMALLLLLHATCCALLYFAARRYVGPWAALVPAAILVVLGPAWQDLLWAFQIGYLGSVAAGLGMVLCLERRDRSGDVGAAVLLGVSLLCSSIGLGMVALGLVMIALQTPGTLRRLWAIAVPVAVYILWYAFYGVSTLRLHNAVHIPRYVAEALSAAVASVTGLAQTHASPYLVSTSLGRYVALIAVILLVAYLIRGGRVPPLTWAALVAVVALWVAECLEYTVPARSAPQSRYQYTAAVLVLLAAVSAVSGRTLSVRTGAVLAVITAVICGSNIAMLNQRSHFWTDNAAYTAAETGAMQVARNSISPDFTPENGFTIPAIGNHNLIIAAGPYLSAVDAFGSSADSPAGILRRSESVREAADLVLSSAERLGLVPAALPAHAPGCRTAQDGAGLGELTLGRGTLTVRVQRGDPAELQLRRFASTYRFVRFGNAPPALGLPRLQDGRALSVRLPKDASGIPWRARLVGGRQVVACFAAG